MYRVLFIENNCGYDAKYGKRYVKTEFFFSFRGFGGLLDEHTHISLLVTWFLFYAIVYVCFVCVWDLYFLSFSSVYIIHTVVGGCPRLGAGLLIRSFNHPVEPSRYSKQLCNLIGYFLAFLLLSFLTILVVATQLRAFERRKVHDDKYESFCTVIDIFIVCYLVEWTMTFLVRTYGTANGLYRL